MAVSVYIPLEHVNFTCNSASPLVAGVSTVNTSLQCSINHTGYRGYYSASCTNWMYITSSTGDISLTTSAMVYSWLQLPLSEQDIGLLGVLVLAVQCTGCRNRRLLLDNERPELTLNHSAGSVQTHFLI